MNNEKTAAKARIEKLKELINDYRYHYHVLDESIMSEAAADSLKHELSQLEEQYPEFITPDSPTQRVAGKPLDKFQKVTHASRMISLADVFSESEIRDWVARNYKLVDRGTEFTIRHILISLLDIGPYISKRIFRHGANKKNIEADKN